MHNQLIDLVFLAVRPIRSLPVWHGARWNALFHTCAKACGLRAEECYDGLLPFASGQRPWMQGAQIRLRFIIRPEQLDAMRRLTGYLCRHAVGEGEFCIGSSLVLYGITDSRHAVTSPDAPAHLARFLAAEALPAVLHPNMLQEEAELMRSLPCWTLRLLSPLRLTMPAGEKGAGTHRYAWPEYFGASPSSLGCLLSRIRLADGAFSPDALPRPAGGELVWQDIAYNRNRQMRLGGLYGTVQYTGVTDADTALRLVAGQYVGAGKNARFGMGFYAIAETSHLRSFSLPPACV